MTHAPDRIWLQLNTEDGEWNDVDPSWCVDKIYDTDVEYVRVPDDVRSILEKWLKQRESRAEMTMRYGPVGAYEHAKQDNAIVKTWFDSLGEKEEG